MERLKFLREEKKLNQQDVANILKINRSTYSSYEIERDTIPIKHLNNLCNYFDISIDYAMGLSKTKKYENSRLEINRKLETQRLKAFRKENKLTQNDVAIILNTSRSTWTGYEYGKYQIPTLLLFDLSNKYNYSMDFLLGKVDINYLKITKPHKSTPKVKNIHKIL